MAVLGVHSDMNGWAKGEPLSSPLRLRVEAGLFAKLVQGETGVPWISKKSLAKGSTKLK